jgi:hypothetical protein
LAKFEPENNFRVIDGKRKKIKGEIKFVPGADKFIDAK